MLDTLTSFSNFYGSDESLVLAGGGNTSAKDENIMYIKGSGTALATITKDGFVKMDRARLAEIFDKKYPDSDKEREAAFLADLMAARMPGEESKRPSVETTLHSLFEYRYVLHLHPALVNGLSCSLGGEKKARELFGDDIIWIEPCRPGYILSVICKKALDDFKTKYGRAGDIILLANHGVFVAADSREELDGKLAKVMDTLKKTVSPSVYPLAARPQSTDKIYAELKNISGGEVCICDDDRALAFAANPTEEILRFTPDHIVYCKAFPLIAADIAEIKNLYSEYLSKYGYAPKVFIIKDEGIFTCGKDKKDAAIALKLVNDALLISEFSHSFGGERFMTDELTDFIINWEAESYRSKKS